MELRSVGELWPPEEKTKILGNLDVQRFLLAMDAVDEGVFNGGPANGNIVCRSQLDPAAAFGYNPWFYYTYYGADYPGADPNAPAWLANDVSQCVPVNVLGGQFTQAQRDYVLRDTVAVGKTKQFNALAFIAGDLVEVVRASWWSGRHRAWRRIPDG